MGKSSRKGTYFENKIAEKIRNKLNLSEFDLHRNTESGTAAHEYGDIRVPFPWIIECKFWNSFNYSRLIKDWNVVVSRFMNQVEADVKQYVKKFKTIPFYTVITASPHNPVVCTFKIRNFKRNDLFSNYELHNAFNKVIIYPDVAIVELNELLEFIHKVVKDGR